MRYDYDKKQDKKSVLKVGKQIAATIYRYQNKVVFTLPYYILYSKGADSPDILKQNYRRLPSLFTNSIEAQQSRRSVVLFKEKSDLSQINTHFAEVAKRKGLNFGKPMNKLSN